MWNFFLVALFCILSAASGIKINSDNFDSVPLNSNATFNCTDAIRNPSFIVMFDGEIARLATDNLDDVDTLALREIIIEGRGTATPKLFVLATDENNGTMIECRDFNFNGIFEFSDLLTLMVIGPPSAPEISVEHISTTELELHWNEPFTWPGYPVLGYSVTQTHLGDIIESVNTTNQTVTYSTASSEGQEPCRNFTFNVTAWSDLGPSDAGSILTGLPIVPPMFERDDVKLEDVTFTQDGHPMATITVQPPVVCDYQTVTLRVELTDESEKNLVKYREYSGNHTSIYFVYEMEDGLIPNMNYTLMVIAISAAANITSESISFNTTFTPRSTFDFTAPPLSELLVPVIGGVAGGLVLLLMLVVLIIIVCCVITQRKAKLAGLQRRSRRGGCSEQRDSTYDYIDDYQTVPPSSRKNQYQPNGYPLRALPRPESPYQAMQAADNGPPSKTCGQDQNNGGPPVNNITDSTPNNDIMHVTPGGSVVYRSRGSASVGSGVGSGEGEYTAMSSVGAVVANQKEIMATRHSVTLPENALPYNGQPNGEYRFTEC